MKKTAILLLFITGTLFGETLDMLLQQYEKTVEKSLRTVNEKLGHVVIYSQKELRLMQYNTLDDILKELPLMSLGKNQLGFSSPLLTGSKSVSGFFRFFINDYEISSAYLHSLSTTWGNLPLDFIDHIEIYYGDSSFSLGNTTGIYFVRIYTKSPKKENGSEVYLLGASNGAHSQSVVHSQSFENGWSYLFFVNASATKDETTFKGSTLKNNGTQRYVYGDIHNDTTKINIGYADAKKDLFTGLSFDAKPDSGRSISQDYFIDLTHHFLEDRSLKANVSVGVNTREYDEKNAQGIGLIPVLNLASLGTTIPKEFYEKATFTKTHAGLTKTFYHDNHNTLVGFHASGKKYSLKERRTVNFLNQTNHNVSYNRFNKEEVYSLLFQHDYRATDNLIFIGNAKLDSYKRNGHLENTTERLFRLGAIYTPSDTLGFKGFYTRTYLPVSFYNADFANKLAPKLTSQQYNIYTAEAVYSKGHSKFNLIYNYVTIDDFIYLTPIGFVNIDRPIKTQGLIANYIHTLPSKDQVHLNYFTSKQNEGASNYQTGGFVKYMGSYQKFDYFASLIYRESFSFYDVHVKDSFDVSLGATYHVNKDISLSLKGENLLKKSTQSLYTEGFPGNYFSLKNVSQRTVSLSLKWVF